MPSRRRRLVSRVVDRPFMVPRTIPKMVLAESFVYGTALKQALTVPVESLTKSTTSNSPSPHRRGRGQSRPRRCCSRSGSTSRRFSCRRMASTTQRRASCSRASWRWRRPPPTRARALCACSSRRRRRAARAAHPQEAEARIAAQSHISRAKLQLREGSELDSPKCGELPVSSMVSVLEQAKLPDGTLRARVAKFGSQMPLGWVSTQGKDELRNLIPFDWTRFARMPRFSASPEAAAPAPAAEAPAADAPPKKPRKMLLSRAPSLKRLQGSARHAGCRAHGSGAGGGGGQEGGVRFAVLAAGGEGQGPA